MPLGLSWNDYKKSLVKRGRVLFDLEFAESWKREVKAMNKRKLRGPYEFPDSHIKFLSFTRVGFDIPYGMVEGPIDSLL